jgi:hypothetical protein
MQKITPFLWFDSHAADEEDRPGGHTAGGR